MPAGRKKKRREMSKKLSEQAKRALFIRKIAITVGLSAAYLVILAVVVKGVLPRGFRKANAETTAEVQEQEDSVEAEVSVAEEEKPDEIQTDQEVTSDLEPDVPEYVKNKPDIDIHSWEYILANQDHSIQDYTPTVEAFEDVYLDERIIDAMTRFVSDARAQGLEVVMTSGYRSYDTQVYLFENKVAEYGDEAVAATIVARPGTSEHQTGLAADICDAYYEYMNESLENTATYQWMSKHCQEYGFIVRFPKNKEDITGIIYEPWHYRYVGVEAATFIMENDLTLEEFTELYQE